MFTSDSTKDRSSNISHVTTWLLVLLVIEMIGMACYTYVDVQRRIQPASLVDEAEKTIRRNYPEIRKRIQGHVQGNAPAIAEQISDEVVASSPEIRRWLERTTARQLKYGLNEATDFSAEQFRVFLQEHRDQIEQAFEQLEDTPEQTRQLLFELEGQLDKQLGADVQEQARTALGLHRQLNVKLERLSSDSALEPKELLERHIVRILWTLEEQRVPAVLDSQ